MDTASATAEVGDAAGPTAMDQRHAHGLRTRAQIIDTAIQLLDEHGEQGLRIAEVTRRSGVSIGSIYHHFGGRDGLIEAARATQFCASPSTYGVRVAELAARSRTAREFARGLSTLDQQAHARDRDRDRYQRVVYVASAAHRPDLLAELRDRQTEMIDAGTAIAQTLIDRGWVRTGVSARAFATLILALEFGGVVGALDARRVADEQWHRVVQLATEGLLCLDGDGPIDEGDPPG